MVVVLGPSEFVDDLQRLLERLEDTVEPSELVRYSIETTFRRGTVVAEDVDDEGVVGVGKACDSIAVEFRTITSAAN